VKQIPLLNTFVDAPGNQVVKDNDELTAVKERRMKQSWRIANSSYKATEKPPTGSWLEVTLPTNFNLSQLIP